MEELFLSLSESVSEGCFKDILNMLEEIISERDVFTRPRAAKRSIPGRSAAHNAAHSAYWNEIKKDMEDKGVEDYKVETDSGKPLYVDREYEDANIHTWTKEPSQEVQKKYEILRKAAQRVSDASRAAGGTVGDAYRHEEEHQKKVAAAKKANK